MLVIDRNKQKLMVVITECNKAKGPQKLQIVLIYLLILAILWRPVASIGTLRSDLIWSDLHVDRILKRFHDFSNSFNLDTWEIKLENELERAHPKVGKTLWNLSRTCRSCSRENLKFGHCLSWLRGSVHTCCYVVIFLCSRCRGLRSNRTIMRHKTLFCTSSCSKCFGGQFLWLPALTWQGA